MYKMEAYKKLCIDPMSMSRLRDEDQSYSALCFNGTLTPLLLCHHV
jgi:hypothetical protein